MTSKTEYQAQSDLGAVRSNNEDQYLVLQEEGLFAVCDGLGGHAAGEIASQIATDTLRERFQNVASDPARFLREAVDEANRKILRDQQTHPERIGMGTTLSAIWLPSADSDKAWIAHIGDSRIYRFRDNRLEQITDDHSPLFRLYKEGTLNKDELRHHPQKNLIERSLGLSTLIECDVFSTKIAPADIFVLCTDGLSDCVSDEDIAEVCRSVDWEEMSPTLIDLALEAGGYDNITVVVLRIGQV